MVFLPTNTPRWPSTVYVSESPTECNQCLPSTSPFQASPWLIVLFVPTGNGTASCDHHTRCLSEIAKMDDQSPHFGCLRLRRQLLLALYYRGDAVVVSCPKVQSTGTRIRIRASIGISSICNIILMTWR